MLAIVASNLKNTLRFFVASLKAKVAFIYPSVLWLKRVYVFKTKQNETSMVLFNLVTYSHWYEKVLKKVKTSGPLVVEVGFQDGTESMLRINVFCAHSRQDNEGATYSRILTPTNVNDGRFTFVFINNRLVRPITNREGTLERNLCYFEEDPIASFRMALTENSIRELEELVMMDNHLHTTQCRMDELKIKYPNAGVIEIN